MRIVRIRIQNFRCIREALIFPCTHNVLLGPNNVGKTAVLEAINLVLNPEMMARAAVIDENDFFEKNYQPPSAEPGTALEDAPRRDPAAGQDTTQDAPQPQGAVEVTPAVYPTIRIELVLAGLNQEDEDVFRDYHVPWKADEHSVIESTEEGTDPFAQAEVAIRVVFEGWYDPEEDGFDYKTYFLRAEGIHRDECPPFTRLHKRHIGFLVYRDFRALTRAITLDPRQLFSRLLSSQEVIPRHFEEVLGPLHAALDPMTNDARFMGVLNAYKAELERFLMLTEARPSALGFQITDGTRNSVKSEAQMYLRDVIELPIQKSGAGTRSLSILAILTLIMRRRGRGILALEEPETFLFPHAQRRVMDECLLLADQTFITTHSPYVLERVPIEGVGRVQRDGTGAVRWGPIAADSAKVVNLYTRRLRQACCEALLGRGVVVTEGDSDRWWLLGASRILNRKTWNGHRHEALELLGVSVVSADTDGDVLKLSSFFQRAGLRVAAVLDRVPEGDPIWAQAAAATFPTVFLRYTGIEALLSECLPEGVLRHLLGSAPHSRTPVMAAATVTALTESEARRNAFDMLRANKGSASMHEWLVSLLNENSLPAPLKNAVHLLAQYMSGHLSLGMTSLT